MRMTVDELKIISTELRKNIVRMHQRGSNVGSAMSAADILAVLYFEIMHIPSPDEPARDRFILSKGHAASALYAALAQKGFIDTALLKDYLADDSILMGHPCQKTVPGVEVSTGSLGHGLPVAVGMAMAAKHDNKTYRIFVLMGDGECQEGSVWEGAMLAARLGLDNITIIIDANNLQGYGRAEEIQAIATLAPKFSAFGWEAREVDGHNQRQLIDTLSTVPFAYGRPSAIIAHTIKGKGVAEMEDKLGWHYFSVPAEKVKPFTNELDRPK